MVNAYPVSHTLQKYYLQIKSIKVSTPKASFGSLNKSDFLNRNTPNPVSVSCGPRSKNNKLQER